MDQTNLYTFPTNKNEALTMLYLQNLNVSEMTPEELVDKYDEVYEKIRQYNKEKRAARNKGPWL